MARVAGSGTPDPIVHATEGEDCAHVLGHLYEYLDSEMTSDDQVRMRAHIAHCAPCLTELSLEELVKQLVRRSCHEQAPPQLRARITAQVSVWRMTTQLH
jgi:anti-sigma factor (TIGR02949 family)